jgi:hypothetical protein
VFDLVYDARIRPWIDAYWKTLNGSKLLAMSVRATVLLCAFQLNFPFSSNYRSFLRDSGVIYYHGGGILVRDLVSKDYYHNFLPSKPIQIFKTVENPISTSMCALS